MGLFLNDGDYQKSLAASFEPALGRVSRSGSGSLKWEWRLRGFRVDDGHSGQDSILSLPGGVPAISGCERARFLEGKGSAQS
jgi:hypothetical protein